MSDSVPRDMRADRSALRVAPKDRARRDVVPGRHEAPARIADVEAVVEATLADLGYVLADIETPNRGRFLRIFIDHANAQGPVADGIKVEDCERASRQLQHVFAVEGIEYDRLEVSSPGLDRVLRKQADFRRFVGCEVELRVRVPTNGRRKFTGVLQSAGESGIEIVVQGAVLTFGWADLDKTRLVPKL